jgi:hypothetical protein
MLKDKLKLMRCLAVLGLIFLTACAKNHSFCPLPVYPEREAIQWLQKQKTMPDAMYEYLDGVGRQQCKLAGKTAMECFEE